MLSKTIETIRQETKLLKEGAFFYFAVMLVNFGNYLYHLIMGRFLSPGDYGAFSALIALTYFFSVPTRGLNLLATKYFSSYKARRERDLISKFYYYFHNKILFYSLLSIIVLFFIAPFISNALQFDSFSLVLIIGLSSAFNILIVFGLSLFQAIFEFNLYGYLVIFQTFAKLFLGIGLVALGMNIWGATLSLLIANVVSYFLEKLLLKRFLETNKKEQEKELSLETDFNFYFLSTMIFAVTSISLYNTDMILVRSFLSPNESGAYGALSSLGKIIFFATTPITIIMFSKISYFKEMEREYWQSFLSFLSLVLFICFSGLTVYHFFPKIIIQLLYGKTYVQNSNFLFSFALFYSLYSLVFFFSNFLFAIKKLGFVWVLCLFSLLQAFLISVFHSGITSIVACSIIINGLLLIIFAGYIFKLRKLAV